MLLDEYYGTFEINFDHLVKTLISKAGLQIIHTKFFRTEHCIVAAVTDLGPLVAQIINLV